MKSLRFLALLSMLLLLTGCGFSPATAPASPSLDASATQEADPAWAQIEKKLERKGVLKDDVETFTIARDDLDVSIESMAIPTSAGIASVFNFYRCPCGKMNVAGQFVVTDYESNDVMDALRKNAAMNIAGVCPMFLYAKPNLVLIRFQGEGDPAALAATVREALRWTAKERMAPEPPATLP